MAKARKRGWVGLALVLVLLASLIVGSAGAPVATGQTTAPTSFFDVFFEIGMTRPPQEAVRMLPNMMSEYLPQGIRPLCDPLMPSSCGDPADPTKPGANATAKMMADKILQVTRRLGSPTAYGQGPVDAEIVAMSLNTGQLVQNMERLAGEANKLLAERNPADPNLSALDAAIGRLKAEAARHEAAGEESLGSHWSIVPGGFEVENPHIIQWIMPWQVVDPWSGIVRPGLPGWLPQVPQETVITPQEPLPIWSSWVVVKESKGMKLVVIKGFVMLNPCEYQKYFPVATVIWHLKLVPAEFVKSIIYTNAWNWEKRAPEVRIRVDKRILREPQLRDFWWLFPKSTSSIAGG